MGNIIYNSFILGALLISTQYKTQHLLEALEAGETFPPSEKCLERVKDKYYGDGVHNYIYCAVQGPNGKKWLNLNLGAEYAKESSPHFNPEAVPTDYNDWKAFGNLYQWGRDSDGHEQVEYRRGRTYWEYRPINGVRFRRLESNEQSNQVVADPNSNGYRVDLHASWEDYHNPCPTGYHILRASDLRELRYTNKIIGGLKTASLFNGVLYENIVIMTSPLSNPNSLPKEGWQETRTLIEPNATDLPGTSTLWMGHSSTKMVLEDWIWKNLDDKPLKYKAFILDRGFWGWGRTFDYYIFDFDPENYDPTWVGDIVSNNRVLLSQMAIRCVQD